MPELAELAAEIVRLAAARNLKISVAESLTGGAVTSALVAVPGASTVLLGGVVAYSVELKQSILGVPESVITEQGTVSDACALEMALGAVALAPSEKSEGGRILAVSTTGVAGPEAVEGKPVGTVFIGVARAGQARSEQHLFIGNRAEIRAQATAAALAALRDEILR
jgi:nicotinamide-nucleotide amidase